MRGSRQLSVFSDRGRRLVGWDGDDVRSGLEILEGDLDDWEPEVPVHFDGRRGGETVKAGVVVAIGLAAQSRCVALGSAGHDGAA